MRSVKRDETYALQDWAPCEAPSSVLGRAEEKSSMPPPPPPGRGCLSRCHKSVASSEVPIPPRYPALIFGS